MISGLRWTGILCSIVVFVGCDDGHHGPKSMDTRTYYGAFNMIVAEVENLNVQVNFDTYKRDYNPIEDQLGSAIYAFMRNDEVKGTPLEAEAQKLLDQTAHIEELCQSPDGSVGEIRIAAAEMTDQVEYMKSLIK